MGAVANIQGDYELGRRLGLEALALQREFGNTEAATISLHNLARVGLRTDRLVEAADLLHQSLEDSRQLEYRELIALCLEACGELAAARGDHDRAARFLGGSEALIAELGISMFADDAESYEETVAAVRTHLGESGFEAARASGRAAPLDQILGDALEFADATRRTDPA
jgi:hypothetical protein